MPYKINYTQRHHSWMVDGAHSQFEASQENTELWSLLLLSDTEKRVKELCNSLKHPS